MQERPGGRLERRSTPPARTAVRVALCVVLVVLNAIILWPLLVQDELAPGELKAGSFDVLAAKTTLLLDDQPLNELYPLIDLYAGGELVIPPGYSAAFPLRPELEYRVRLIDNATAPYVVLGSAVPLSPSMRLDRQAADSPRPPNPAYLADPKVLAADPGRSLGFQSWDAAMPWRMDAHRLSALTSSCAQPNEGAQLAVRMHDDRAVMRLGRCTTETTLARTVNAAPMMAVLAGPNPTVVEKNPRGWSHRSRVVRSPVASFAQMLLLAHAAVAAAAIGLVSGVVVVAFLALASVLFPFEAALVWLLIGVLGIVVAYVRLTYRLGWARSTMLPVTIVAALLVALLIRGAGPKPLDLRSAAFDASKGAPRCLLTGYSTAADAGLHYGTPGVYGLLDSACPACTGGTARVAWRGGSFADIRDTICADESPVVEGQEIVFLGGTNDDFQLPLQATDSGDRLRGLIAAARIMFLLRELPKTTDAVDGSQTLMVSLETAQRNASAQSALIRQALECARRRRARFWFFHDYIASDLTAGPSRGRAFLHDQRRRDVEASQEKFVSLLATTADRAGVSWFNDIVHLSAIGHREVEEIICAMLETP